MRARDSSAARLLLLCLALPALGVLASGCRRKAAPIRPPELVQYEQGMQRMQRGDAAGAQASFDTALRLNPDFVPAYLALVEMDQKAGNFAQAVERLETLRRAAPMTPHVLCREAELYLASGRFVRGIETARAALQSEPDCPLAHAQLG